MKHRSPSWGGSWYCCLVLVPVWSRMGCRCPLREAGSWSDCLFCSARWWGVSRNRRLGKPPSWEPEVGECDCREQVVSTRTTYEKEIRRRISTGWGAFCKHLINSRLHLSLKRMVYNRCKLSVLSYEAVTWCLSTLEENLHQPKEPRKERWESNAWGKEMSVIG